MYVCMYVCMYVYIHTQTCINIWHTSLRCEMVAMDGGPDGGFMNGLGWFAVIQGLGHVRTS